jgi:glutamate-1-semialdehyde 2,1-aminomutase
LAKLLRQKLNALFSEQFTDWVAFGDFSFVHLLTHYEGPRPDSDDYLPYGGALDKLDNPKDPKLVHGFRQGLLLHGVDWPGLGCFLTAAHSEQDIEKTVDAIGQTIEMLRAEGLA